MLEARDGFLNTRPGPGRYPPHHKIRAIEVFEPFRTTAVEPFVDRLIDEALERLDIFPNRQVDRDAGIGIWPRARGVPAFVSVTPDETRRALGQAVHHRQVVGEIRHARIIDLVANATDVQLCKMMIEWLLQGDCSTANDEFEPKLTHFRRPQLV